MHDKVFLDTNILIYVYSADEPKKQSIALQLLDSFEDSVIISKQIINELSNILLKKFKLSSEQVENVLLEIDNVLPKYQSLQDAQEALGEVATISSLFIDFQKYLYQQIA